MNVADFQVQFKIITNIGTLVRPPPTPPTFAIPIIIGISKYPKISKGSTGNKSLWTHRPELHTWREKQSFDEVQFKAQLVIKNRQIK